MNHIAGEPLVVEVNLEVCGDVTRAPGCVVAQRVWVTRAEDGRGGCCGHVQCADLDIAANSSRSLIKGN